ncbi:MAG TPA: Crp/Fnr family transcriptional regulator [Arachidicoccus sp.]
MKVFIEYILQFGNLNQQQIDFILKKTKELELRKDEYFSEAGKVPKYCGFIVEGVIRICYYNNKGEEITKYFLDENSVVSDYFNFMESLVASEYLQAVTDCKLLVFSKQDWKEISDTIVDWDNILNKMIQKFLFQKLNKKGQLIEQDATTRYLTFIEKFPTLVNRVPLSYIASYLGITQSSLSRIRKNIR